MNNFESRAEMLFASEFKLKKNSKQFVIHTLNTPIKRWNTIKYSPDFIIPKDMYKFKIENFIWIEIKGRRRDKYTSKLPLIYNYCYHNNIIFLEIIPSKDLWK